MDKPSFNPQKPFQVAGQSPSNAKPKFDTSKPFQIESEAKGEKIGRASCRERV